MLIRFLPLVFVWLCSTFWVQAQPNVIIDLDIDSDVDDVSALAMLHTLHNQKRINLLGIIVTSNDSAAASCAGVTNTYFGNGEIPIGVLKNQADLHHFSRYTRQLATEFPHSTPELNELPDATSLYRKLLVGAPDESVTIVTIGHLSNFRNLLQSRKDRYSSLNGQQLTEKKVKQWLCMGGKFPAGKEANFYRPDPASTVYCVKAWKKPVVFAGWEVGKEIVTGGAYLKRKIDPASPVYRAYELYNNFDGRASWDQVAVLLLTDTWPTYFELETDGYCAVEADGSNKWVTGAARNHAYVKLKPGIDVGVIAKQIDDMAVRPGDVAQWTIYEHSFTSAREYENALYDVREMNVQFSSPSGKIINAMAFWDGGTTWKVRFSPGETGVWQWRSVCSDSLNAGLHQQAGKFTCVRNTDSLAFYSHGPVVRPKTSYHLMHSDGHPFFWTACTAWNGTLKSTEEEWEMYLRNRASLGYNVIQFVTTQWRGGDKNSLGQVAFEGSGRISINPAFFTHLDGKINKINEHGLLAAPVLLWALGSVQGRELSPGYYLPEQEAVLLARYMVARYGAHQVIWILGGDGKYTDENEQRWKTIGRRVFSEPHTTPVALHPGGGSWIGEAYAQEHWLDIIGYQSGHNRSLNAVRFITSGPVAKNWHKLAPRAFINMEPVYEEIGKDITATDIRNAAYWSVLSTPVAGITYGANGIWPWLRDGELILNHGATGEESSRWYKAINLPGSVQTGYLANFMRSLPWWLLVPAPELLVDQPGERDARQFISASKTADEKLIVVYVPNALSVKILNRLQYRYRARQFDPVTNSVCTPKLIDRGSLLEVLPTVTGDCLLVLEAQ